MAKCAVCGKSVHFGNKVSHSHRRSNKMWKPNIKSVKVGKWWYKENASMYRMFAFWSSRACVGAYMVIYRDRVFRSLFLIDRKGRLKILSINCKKDYIPGSGR